MKPIDSEITLLLERAERAQNTTGMELGETGFAKPLTISDDVLRDRLLTRAPEATDRLLSTSLKSIGVDTEIQRESRFPAGGGYVSVPVRCGIALEPHANPRQALVWLEAATTPPTSEQAGEWLTALQAATAGGRRSEAGTEMAYELYAGALRRYPADVARAACVELATQPRKGGNWFPTLSDLIAVCERLATPRVLMIAAVRRALGKVDCTQGARPMCGVS